MRSATEREPAGFVLSCFHVIPVYRVINHYDYEKDER